VFVDHTVFYDIWSLKVSKTTEMYFFWVSYRHPTAHFCFTPTPLEFLTAHFGNHCTNHSTMLTLLLELNVVCEQRWIPFELQNSPTRVLEFDDKIYTAI